MVWTLRIPIEHCHGAGGMAAQLDDFQFEIPGVNCAGFKGHVGGYLDLGDVFAAGCRGSAGVFNHLAERSDMVPMRVRGDDMRDLGSLSCIRTSFLKH